MTVNAPAAMVQQLVRVLQTEFNPAIAARGAQLVKRLQGPVQIAVIGRVGAGKTRLVELLSRHRDLPAFAIAETIFSNDLAQLRSVTADADIVLCCAQELSAAEISLWSKLTDVVKDHSFLILTKADLLAAQERLQTTLQNLDLIAAEEFHSLFPVATLQAIDASSPGFSAAFRASGAAAFMTALLHQLALDREATHDSAVLFLDRYGKSAETAAPVANIAREKPPALDPLHYLQQRAEALRAVGDLPLPDKIRAILIHCSETAEGLANLLDQSNPDSAEDKALVQEVLTVADTMTLLTLEASASAAIDALALLLQIHSDLSQLPVS